MGTLTQAGVGLAQKPGKNVPSRLASLLAGCSVLLLCLTTVGAVPPLPTQPILVVTDANSTNPYQQFVAEILRTEGIQEFQEAELADLDSTFLANYDVVILPSFALTAQQALLLEGYVTNGGFLIALRPDLQLASLFGVVAQGGTLAEGWLKIDNSQSAGAGLETQTMKFHGVADTYLATTATTLATLYQDAVTPTSFPALALNQAGSGRAAFFSFDLAESIVLMRQGNPAWAGYPNNHDGFGSMRPSQMFLDVTTGVNWNEVADGTQPEHRNDVPQADEQMRLLSNLLILENAARTPLPRFWYLPGQKKAMLLMTGDQHGESELISISEIQVIELFGGLFANYLWHPFDSVDAATVTNWLAAGHEVGIHFDDTAETDATGIAGSQVTWSGMRNVVAIATSDFSLAYPTAPAPQTARNHVLLWASSDGLGNPDQTAQARIFRDFGIEMDTTFSAFPRSWGYMTGSGLPMKFLDTQSGEVIPVYEQATQFEDDVQLGSFGYSLTWTLPTAQAKFEQALADSQTKYHTPVTMLFHPDQWVLYQPHAEAAMQFAQTNGIPIWTPRKWLEFWKGREAAGFANIVFGANTLSFNVSNAITDLTLLVPHRSGSTAVSAIDIDGVQQNYNVETLSGIGYASLVLTPGNHGVTVSYSPVWSLSGQVTPTEAVQSTTLTLTGGPDNLSLTTQPAADGTYQFDGLLDGIYTVTPSASAYTFNPASQTVTISGADAVGVNFTATVVSVTQTLFTTETPVQPNLTDGVEYELGLRFLSDVVGEVTAIRFWKATSEAGSHVGKLWSATGQLLASVTFANETASGWQQQALPTPVQIAANTEYMVSVNTGSTFYVVSDNGLAQQVVNQHLSSVVGNNGVFGPPGAFPTNTFASSNYFRDIVFTTDRTFALAGTITPAADAGGATVTLTGFSGGTTTADSAGAYSFAGLANGTYTITPSKPEFVFTPPSQSVTVSGADITGINFTVAPVTYSLSGTISPAADGSGATVTVSGPASATVTADASGTFVVGGLRNGTYTVTASKPGFAFDPLSQTVTIAGADVLGVDFVALAAGGGTFALSGLMSPATDASGAVVTLSGAANGTTTVDTSGAYGFSGLPDGSYTVTPTKEGFDFSPTAQTVTVAGANVTGVDFTVSKVAVVQTLFTTQTPVLTNLSDGPTVNYELGLRFLSDVAGQITAVRFWKASNETGTHVGKLWSATGLLLASVTFANETASGWQQQALPTPVAIAASTEYVATVNTGNTFYVVTDNGLAQQVVNQRLRSVVGSNGVYGPPGAFPTNTFASSNYFRDVVFTDATGPLPTSFTLSGAISPAADGSGTTVTLSGDASRTTTADASGSYAFADLPNGTFVVSPSKGGFIFSPTSQIVTINGQDVSGVNFTVSSLQGQNSIVIENSNAGTASWQLSNPAFSNEIEGYGGATSINKGESITFFVNSNGAPVTLDVYRLGWYQGLGGRLMFSAGTLPGQTQPGCPTDSATGLIECQWSASATVTSGLDWMTGVYVAKITRTDTGKDNHIVFVVRDDASTADILFQSSVTTMQAYNNWGGKSLYSFQSSPPNPTQSVSTAAVKVSFDRPFNTFDPLKSADFSEHVLRWEYMMVRWLESQGFDVSYSTNLDTHSNGAALLQHPVFITVGHDEYWSSQMRNNVEAARDAGTHLAFFSANTSYWQVRFEPSSSAVPNRVMVGYKESTPSFDPLGNDPALATARFRDSPVNRPENRLLGVMFGGFTDQFAGFPFVVTNSAHPFFRNTGLTDGTALFGLVGNEWDNTRGVPTSDNPATIPGLVVLSNSPTNPGSFANAAVYETTAGSLVFAAGTIQWAWGLDNFNTPVNAADARVRQITANVLMDFGALPTTPSPDLVVSTTSSLSGTISPALADVTVTLSGAASKVTTTDANGNYVFQTLLDGTYTVTPSKLGFSFTPASQTVTLAGADLGGVSFTASNQTFVLSGSLSPAADGAGATVGLTGTASSSTSADASGNYSFSGLPNGGYTVTPAKTGLLFVPLDQAVTISGVDVPGVNFTAHVVGQGAFTISGTITPAADAAGTTVTLTGDASATTTVDPAGNYSFANVPNGTYTVTPSQTGFSFSPTSQTLQVTGASVGGVNFTVTPAVPPHTLLTTQVPQFTNLNDGVSYELGMRFFSNVSGQITAVRFWKASSETGIHVGNIWSATGQLLASVTFANETVSGWQEQALPAPLAISANTEYMVTVNTGSGFYVVTDDGFAIEIVNGNLHSVVGGNGRYGPPGLFPTNTFRSSNYFRDVVFVPD